MAGSIIKNLRAIASLDVSGFTAGVGKFLRDTREMRQAWGDAVRDINSMANRLAVGMTAAGGAVIGLGFKVNNAAQQSKIAFTTILGSSQAAEKHLKELYKFAETTPFNVSGVVDASRKLLAMGFSADQVLPSLRNISDTVSAMGGGTDMLNRVVTALGQIQAKGKLASQEMMQLTENGIPAWDMLAKALNTNVADAMDRVSNGLVSSDVAIRALMDGMQSRFGGLSSLQSKTFGGMLSNIQDFAERAAGDITKPLFDAVTRLMSRLMQWAQGAEFRGIIQSLQSQFAEFASWLETALPNMIAEFRNMAPAILDAAKTFGSFLATIAKFLAEHPRLAAALLALKVGGFLGINQALLSTGTAIASTVAGFAKMVGGAAALKAAMMALGVALAAYLIAKLSGALDVISQFNRETEKSQRLADRLYEQEEKRHKARLALAERATPEQRKSYLEAEIAKDLKNLKSLEQAVKAAEKALDDMNEADDAAVGGAIFRDLNQQLKEAETRFENAKRRVVELRDAIDKPGEAKAPGAPGGGVPQPAAPAADAESPEDKAKAEEKRVEKIKQTMIDFEDTFLDFERDGEATRAELEALFRDAVKLRDAAIAGKITQQQLEQGLETIEVGVKKRHDAKVEADRQKQQDDQAAIDTSNRFTLSMRELQRDGAITTDQFMSLQARAQELAAQAQNGAISLIDLNLELNDLAWETKRAADAAKKAQEQEAELAKLRALASGNFAAAGLNPQMELMKRLAGMRMQQFNDYIDRAAKAMLGLSDNTDKATKGLGAFEGGFAGAMAGSRGGGGGFDEALSKLQQFLTSREGLIASIRNQISLLQQNINAGRSFGIPADRIRQWESMITQLLQQLTTLTETPTFTAFDSNMAAPVDPVLVRDANEPGRGGVSGKIADRIEFVFPQINRWNSVAADEAVDQIRQAFIRRTGRDPFTVETFR